MAKTTKKRSSSRSPAAKLRVGKIVVRELTPRSGAGVKGGIEATACRSHPSKG